MKKPTMSNIERVQQEFEGYFNELNEIIGLPDLNFDEHFLRDTTAGCDDFHSLMMKVYLMNAASRERTALSFVLAACGSPIEKMLLAALQFHCVFASSKEFLPVMDLRELEIDPISLDTTLQVVPQYHVGPYRIDFYVRQLEFDPDPSHPRGGTWNSRQVLVECDGHDFHEKTKDQVARDKKRDRYLQQQGFSLLRFSGSEIWKSPMSVAGEICGFLESKGARR